MPTLPIIDPNNQLALGEFVSVGDVYVLELLPITGILSVQSFSDVLTGEDTDRIFKKEFSYVKNSLPSTSYQPLTEANLQAISGISPNDVFIFRFRYTRIGTDFSGVLIWNEFILGSVDVQPCFTLRTNKENWVELYGNDEKYIEINNQIRKFNDWAVPIYGFYLFMVDDITVPETQIYLDKVVDAPCLPKDLNVILKTLWGNYLVDYNFKIDVDLWDGVRS